MYLMKVTDASVAVVEHMGVIGGRDEVRGVGQGWPEQALVSRRDLTFILNVSAGRFWTVDSQLYDLNM